MPLIKPRIGKKLLELREKPAEAPKLEGADETVAGVKIRRLLPIISNMPMLVGVEAEAGFRALKQSFSERVKENAEHRLREVVLGGNPSEVSEHYDEAVREFSKSLVPWIMEKTVGTQTSIPDLFFEISRPLKELILSPQNRTLASLTPAKSKAEKEGVDPQNLKAFVENAVKAGVVSTEELEQRLDAFLDRLTEGGISSELVDKLEKEEFGPLLSGLGTGIDSETTPEQLEEDSLILPASIREDLGGALIDHAKLGILEQLNEASGKLLETNPEAFIEWLWTSPAKIDVDAIRRQVDEEIRSKDETISPAERREMIEPHIDGALRELFRELGVDMIHQKGYLPHKLVEVLWTLFGQGFSEEGRKYVKEELNKLVSAGALSGLAPLSSLDKLDNERRGAVMKYPDKEHPINRDTIEEAKRVARSGERRESEANSICSIIHEHLRRDIEALKEALTALKEKRHMPTLDEETIEALETLLENPLLAVSLGSEEEFSQVRDALSRIREGDREVSDTSGLTEQAARIAKKIYDGFAGDIEREEAFRRGELDPLADLDFESAFEGAVRHILSRGE